MKSLYDKNGEYAFLPKELRDFHNQKDLFKDLYKDGYDEWVKSAVEEHGSRMFDTLKDISWVDMQILMCDYILFNLARKGYVLRKSNRFVLNKEA